MMKQGGKFSTSDELADLLKELGADVAVLTAEEPMPLARTIYIRNRADGNVFTKAELEITTLTDGSKVADIYLA